MKLWREVFSRLFIFTVMAVLLTFGLAASAEETAKEPVVYVETAEPDENGFFSVCVSFENVDFMTYQLAFKYNTKAAVPCKKDGTETDDYSEFASLNKIDEVNYIGAELDRDKGMFCFTSYVTPLAETGASQVGTIHIGEKTKIVSFKFKKISDEPFELDVASIYTGDVYDEHFKDGAAIILDGIIPTKILISSDGEITERQSVKYSYNQLNPLKFTKEQRLKDTVYLVENDYAAAVDGALKAIDSENKNVTPYKIDETVYYPLRFVCESLGAEVLWNEESETVTVKTKDGETSTISTKDGNVTIGANTYKDEVVLENARTMVSEKVITDVLNVRVYTDGSSHIVYGGIVEWKPEREAEKEAISAMQYVLMPMFRIFL